MIAACHLLEAAQSFHEQEFDRGFNAIILASRCHNISMVVNLTGYLVSYCARAGKTKSVPEFIKNAVKGLSAEESEDDVIAARCAYAIGEVELAKEVYKRVLPRYPEPDNPVRIEYAAILCHEAVIAYGENNVRQAIACLREARKVLAK